MGVRGWRKMAGDLDVWRFILQQDRVMNGQQSQWRREEAETKNSVSSLICLYKFL